MIIVSKYYKNPSRHIQEEAFYDFGHTDRYTHAISSLNSLFPFALPPPKSWCHHCYYLLINRKLYSLQKNIYFSPSYTLHHYFKILSNHHINFMNLGVLNLFTLHHCFVLNLKTKFQKNIFQTKHFLAIN